MKNKNTIKKEAEMMTIIEQSLDKEAKLGQIGTVFFRKNSIKMKKIYRARARAFD